MFNFQSIPWRGLRLSILLLCPALLGAAALGFARQNPFWGLYIGLFAVLGLILAVIYERSIFYLLVFLLPIAEALRFDFLPTTLLIFPGALALISLAAAILLRGKIIFLYHWVLLWAALLALWATLATAVVGSPAEARPYWLVLILLLLTIQTLTQKEHFLRAIWLLIIPLGLMGIYVFAVRLTAYLAQQTFSTGTLSLTRFLVGDKNVIGMWFTMGIPLVYYLSGYYRHQSTKRFVLLLAGISMFLGAVATISIGAAIGLIAMVVIVIWLETEDSTRLRQLAMGGLIIVIMFSGPVSDRLQSQDLTTLDSQWGTYRGALWFAGLQTIEDHPVFGIGLAPARRTALLKYVNIWFIHNWYRRNVLVVPHNIFLSVGVDVGVPGLIFYLALLFSVFITLWNVRKRSIIAGNLFTTRFANMLLATLITGWVQGLGLSVHLDKITWFVMGAAVVLTRISTTSKK